MKGNSSNPSSFKQLFLIISESEADQSRFIHFPILQKRDKQEKRARCLERFFSFPISLFSFSVNIIFVAHTSVLMCATICNHMCST